MVREGGVFRGSGPRTSSKRRVPCEQTPRSCEDQIFTVGTGSLFERCIVCATGHSRGLSVCSNVSVLLTVRETFFGIQLGISKTPLIRTLVIRIANYPDQVGPSCKHFRIEIVLRLFMV